MKARQPRPPREFLLKLELRSDPCLLRVVRGAVERLAEHIGFSAQAVRAVTRAVDEALTNIMRHSYGGAPDKAITLYFRRVQRTGSGLEIQLWDRGVKFDLAKVHVCDPQEIRPGGLGLLFIRQSVDEVEYTRVGRDNCLRLVKFLPELEGDVRRKS
jgi:serine/threonine-protein kinase RsbW